MLNMIERSSKSLIGPERAPKETRGVFCKAFEKKVVEDGLQNEMAVQDKEAKEEEKKDGDSCLWRKG